MSGSGHQGIGAAAIGPAQDGFGVATSELTTEPHSHEARLRLSRR
jgi:hypothetical protein